MRLTPFKMLTFDTYGTLIDWESGIHTALRPLIERASPPPSRDTALEKFALVETAQQAATPGMKYSDLLATCFRKIAKDWGVEAAEDEAVVFGKSVKEWPAFADAPAALWVLRGHYLMATLTNCDRVSYMGSNARLEIEWDAIWTAQDVGSYKPDLRNFECLFEWARRDFGVRPAEILHVAQSLTHDMVPATAMGMKTVWINRRHDQPGYGATKPPEGPYTIDREFPSMAAFAEAVTAEGKAG